MTTPDISLTLFKSQFDNKTHRKMDFDSWEKFVDLLYKLADVSKEGKRDAELISPAVYKNGTTRANKNVSYWAGWAAVDVDDYTASYDELRDSLKEKLGEYEWLCYSTASSSIGQPKFRLVFPLSRDVQSEEIPHFWFALNTEIGDLSDVQTKDLSRMYYIPAKYKDANNFIFLETGKRINVDELLDKHPYVDRAKSGGTFLDRLPPELADAVVNHRKSTLESNSTNIVWTGYADCPFFPKKLALEYRVITGTGWYHKMYQIMVATASNAIKREYPITATQIAELCRELDVETGNWYENRPLQVEADRALEYAYRNC
jgi:hypothetical protein